MFGQQSHNLCCQKQWQKRWQQPQPRPRQQHGHQSSIPLIRTLLSPALSSGLGLIRSFDWLSACIWRATWSGLFTALGKPPATPLYHSLSLSLAFSLSAVNRVVKAFPGLGPRLFSVHMVNICFYARAAGAAIAEPEWHLYAHYIYY